MLQILLTIWLRLFAVIFFAKIILWCLDEIKGNKFSCHLVLLDVVFRFVERTSDAVIFYSICRAQCYRRIVVNDSRILVVVNVVDKDERW